MAHKFRVRIYYEATDAGGVVYHANYLSLFAQARTEWAREHDWHIGDLVKQGMLMPIRHIDIDYLKPCFLDDVLIIHSEIESVKRCSARFFQTAVRECEPEQTVCEVRTRIACVDKNLKPCPWPQGLWTDMLKGD